MTLAGEKLIYFIYKIGQPQNLIFELAGTESLLWFEVLKHFSGSYLYALSTADIRITYYTLFCKQCTVQSNTSYTAHAIKSKRYRPHYIHYTKSNGHSRRKITKFQNSQFVTRMQISNYIIGIFFPRVGIISSLAIIKKQFTYWGKRTVFFFPGKSLGPTHLLDFWQVCFFSSRFFSILAILFFFLGKV